MAFERTNWATNAGKSVIVGLGALAAIALLGLAVSCSDGGSGSDGGVGAKSTTLVVVDNWRRPLNGAEIYVNGSISPTATTDSGGQAQLALDGPTDDVVVRYPGHGAYAYVARDFSGIDPVTVVLAKQADLLLPPGSGTMSISVVGGAPGTQAFVSSWTDTGFAAGTVVTLDGSGAGSGTLDVPAGEHVVVAYSYDTSLPPAQAFFGRVAPVWVTDGGTTPVVVPVVAGGKAFTLSGSNGLPGGNLFLQMYIYGRPDWCELLAARRRSFAATSVVDEPFTMPTNDTNLAGNRTLGVWIGSSDDATVAHGWTQLAHFLRFDSRSELLASPATYDVTLPDFGITGIVPAHDAAGVPTQPTVSFGHSADSVTWVEIEIERFVLDALGSPLGTVPAITVRKYADTGSIALPAPLSLDADAYYRFRVRVRQEAGNVLRWHRVGGMCFSTGATSPSAAGVCGP